ncbi:MAG: endolytic transglycosylase MltG [Pseudomonadota bacterium]
MRRFLFFILFLAVMAGLGTAWWLHRPLTLKTTPLDLSIEPGTSARGVASAVAAAGVDISPWMLAALFRVTSSERLIKAGSYELEASTTPLSLLRKLVRGEESLLALTLVEGWNIRQVREALRKADLLRPDTAELSELALMDKLGRPIPMPKAAVTWPCCSAPCGPWTVNWQRPGRSGHQAWRSRARMMR